MRIEVKRTFLHGRERFEKGDIFTVSDEPCERRCGCKAAPCATWGEHFVKQGWAVELGQPAPEVQPAGEVTLDIQNSNVGVKERKHG